MTIWYLDFNDGDDALAGTSPETAKQTLTGLTLTSGDTVRCKRGTTLNVYARYQAPSGVDNILIEPYGSGPKPCINGFFDPTDATSSTFQLSNRANWTFDSLKITRSLPDIYRAVPVFDLRGASVKDCYITIKNCDIQGGGDCIRIIDNINYTKIINCNLSGCFTDVIWIRPGTGTEIIGNTIGSYSVGDTLGDGIQMSEGTGTLLIEGNKIIMPPNVVKQGIFVQSDSLTAFTTIKNNVVYNPGVAGASISIEGSGEIIGNICVGNVSRGFSITSKADNQIARCISNFTISNYPTNSYGVFIDGEHTGKTVEVLNNTIIGQFQKGIYLYRTSGGTAKITNNYVDGRGRTLAPCIGIDNESAITPTVSYNNIINCLATVEGTMTESNTTSVTGTLNSYYQATSTTPTGEYINNVQDLFLKYFWNPPSIGAVEYIRPKTVVSTRTMRS